MKALLGFSLVVSAIFCYACQYESNSFRDVLEIPVRSKMDCNDVIPVKEDVERIDYISLETNDSCLISNVLSLQVTREYIFVYNGKTDQIFQFDRTGKFIRQVGRHGNGPGEFDVVLNLCVDELKQEVYIFQYSAPPLVYSFTGEFLRSETIRATDMHVLADGSRILKGLTMAPLAYAPWMVAVQNVEGEVIDSVVPYASEWRNQNCFMKDILFSPVNAKTLLAFTECNDTIFRVSGDGCRSAWVLDRGNSAGYHQRIADIEQFRNNPVHEQDIEVIDFFETAGFVYLRYYKDGYYLQRVSKEDGSVLSQRVPDEYLKATIRIPCQDVIGIPNDIDGGVPFWPEFYVNDRQRAQMVTYLNIQKLYDEKAVGVLPEELRRIGEYDNPIVILYTFRDK